MIHPDYDNTFGKTGECEEKVRVQATDEAEGAPSSPSQLHAQRPWEEQAYITIRDDNVFCVFLKLYDLMIWCIMYPKNKTNDTFDRVGRTNCLSDV